MSEVLFNEEWEFLDVIQYEGKEYHVMGRRDEDYILDEIKIVEYHNGFNEWGAAVGEGYYSEVEDGVLLAALDEIFRISFGYEA